jgi:uncharacterized protein DUF5565
VKKIPTVFVRDLKTHKVIDEVVPGCEWVLAGEGTATRKYDGTCVRFDGSEWWARREVKPGKAAPERFVSEGYDENTGKTVGWIPAEDSDFWPLMVEAGALAYEFKEGTYELIGPKVNGNPEGRDTHELIPHGEFVIGDAPRTYDSLREYLTHDFPFEGIVWHHEDGRMAKLKVRDF